LNFLSIRWQKKVLFEFQFFCHLKAKSKRIGKYFYFAESFFVVSGWGCWEIEGFWGWLELG
jgi:hypothetical protein